MSVRTPVRAAGCVIWRERKGGLEVLLVHRKRYRDISIPKGKVDRGETLMQTAVREMREETGLSVSLGPPVGTSIYRQSSGRRKVVEYWAAEATPQCLAESTFSPNSEISAIEWVTLQRARKLVSYAEDTTILDSFARLMAHAPHRTTPLIVLRHAEARPRSDWSKDDSDRPLTPRGRRDARRLASTLQAYGIRRVVSSPATRCRQTIMPLTTLLDLRVRESADISQAAWESGDADVAAVVGKRLSARKSAVICSHRPVIPEIMRQILLAADSVSGPYFHGSPTLPPGGFAVVHVARDETGTRIVAVETHSPA